MLTLRRPLIILSIIALLLLIPFIGMQISNEVHWSVFDFLVAGGLLTITGFAIDFVIRKTKSVNRRFLLITALALLFLLIWIEIAVGLFGSPIAGS